MFRSILVPLDGSRRAERILPYVEEMALAQESVVIVLHVVEPALVIAGPYETAFTYDREASARAVTEARRYVEQTVAKLQEKGIAARGAIEYTPVAQAVLEVAEREGADLIAMASHGRTGLARVFYGSVAAAILQQADRPLLLIRSSSEV